MRALSFAILIAALVLGMGIWGVKRNAVTGSITFCCDREIPAGAALTVQLRDVSWQDAPSTLIASQTIEDPRSFPVDFAVHYQRNDIDRRAIYAIQVNITLHGRLLYINDTAFEVLTHGNPRRGVDMWVVLVDGEK